MAKDLAGKSATVKIAKSARVPGKRAGAPAAQTSSDPTAISGILPAQAIRAAVQAGSIVLEIPLGPKQLQPASLDLRLGQVAHRVRASFLPGPGSRIGDKLKDLHLHTFDLTRGAVLETGCVYIVPLLESLKLPDHLSAAANPKSSTGRLDVFTRIIADGVSAFDQIPAGYDGPLYAEICPQTFPIVVHRGSTLSQLRLRCGDPQVSDADLKALHSRERLVSGGVENIDNGIALSVDLTGDQNGLIGYRAKRHTALVDVDVSGACAIADFWEPIMARDARRLILDPDQFYILASKEAVHVPPAYAAEMMPFNPLVGEFRVHYAGFMDPGFGHAGAGGSGARVVLEVRSHKVPFVLEDGQIIGRLIYERLTEPPETLYGQDLGSNYQGQSLKLSKHFK
jgi:dCTP deaminase